MLAKPNRVVSADDFRTTMRKGRRVSAEHVVVFLSDRPAGSPSRFGFVVSKVVGNAVVRNRLRRRLRAISSTVAIENPGRDIVVRALPGSGQLHWDTLQDEIITAMAKGMRR